jgi:hypothetical protein
LRVDWMRERSTITTITKITTITNLATITNLH